MRPKQFKEANVTFAKDQPEYQPLPAFRSDSPQGEVITCWNLSFKERLRILFKGEIYLCLLTFNKPLTPSFMTTKKSDVLITNDVRQYQVQEILNYFEYLKWDFKTNENVHFWQDVMSELDGFVAQLITNRALCRNRHGKADKEKSQQKRQLIINLPSTKFPIFALTRIKL